MPTTTPNFGFQLPLVNNATDQDLWGGYLNSNFTLLDTLLLTVEPSGEVKFFPTSTAPTGHVELAGQLISRTTYPNLYAFAVASGNISSADTSAINAGGIINAGSAYTPGTYPNVALTGGYGSGAIGTVVVGSGGTITSVSLTTNPTLAVGSAYVVGDQLTAPASSIGGTGSGFVYQVQSLTGWDLGMFSPGDGTTTFRIPDYRGKFLRGWSHGKNGNARVLGSAEVDQMNQIALTDPTHQHGSPDGNGFLTNAPGYPIQTGSGDVIFPSAAHTASASTGITLSVGGAQGTETRPKNVAGMYCIKT